jgi:hypothetical protein
MTLPHVITVITNSLGMKGASGVLDVGAAIIPISRTMLVSTMTGINESAITKRTINTMKRSGNFHRQQILFNILNEHQISLQ